MSRAVKDLTGFRSGKLTATKFLGINAKDGYALWLCRCVCNQTRVVSSRMLCSRRTRSCGCTADAIKEKRAARRAKWMEERRGGNSEEDTKLLTQLLETFDRRRAQVFEDQLAAAAADAAEEDDGPKPAAEPTNRDPDTRPGIKITFSKYEG